LQPVVEAWSSGGILRFRAVLAIPPDKNDRLAPNCIRAEPGGRLYFKRGEGLWKLSPAALKWRAQLHEMMSRALPRKPFFVKDIPWWFIVHAYGEGDVDHWVYGLLDDVCSGGLAKGDSDCRYHRPEVHETDGEPYVEVYAMQEIDHA